MGRGACLAVSSRPLGQRQKRPLGSCSQVLCVSFNCFSGFCLVLDPRGRLGGKAGSACEEIENNEGGILG